MHLLIHLFFLFVDLFLMLMVFYIVSLLLKTKAKLNLVVTTMTNKVFCFKRLMSGMLWRSLPKWMRHQNKVLCTETAHMCRWWETSCSTLWPVICEEACAKFISENLPPPNKEEKMSSMCGRGCCIVCNTGLMMTLKSPHFQPFPSRAQGLWAWPSHLTRPRIAPTCSVDGTLKSHLNI